MPGLSRRRQPLDPEALFAPLHDFKRVALAVSGGADSLALMLLAHEYARSSGDLDRFIVYSVDHGLRPEAADEAAFVVREAQRLGFHARALKWRGRKPRTGVQEVARAARYRLISDAMREDGAEVLPTLEALGLTAERLGKFAVRMRDADRLASAAAGQVATAIDPATGERSIARDALRRLPRAVAVKVIGRMLAGAGGGQKPYDLAPVEALTDRLVREPVRTTLHGCIVRANKTTIRIGREPGRAAAKKARMEPTEA